MTQDRPRETGPDPLERARRVHAICEDHEADWRAGRRPRIEDQLARAPESDRAELLAELIGLVVELRRRGGERPAPEDYLARFPGHEAAIATAFDGPAADAGARRPGGPMSDEAPGPTCPGPTARDPPPKARFGNSATSRCWRRSRAAAWGSSTRRGRRASIAWSP